MKKRELTEAEKKDLQMKTEIAEELGLMEKVEQLGWKGLTARESGRIGGIMGQRKMEERKMKLYKEEKNRLNGEVPLFMLANKDISRYNIKL